MIDKPRCAMCKKPMTVNDELEYSNEYDELYCSPDCAMTDYFKRAGSIKIEQKDKKKYLKECW